MYIYITEILKYVYWASKGDSVDYTHKSHPKRPSQVLMYVISPDARIFARWRVRGLPLLGDAQLEAVIVGTMSALRALVSRACGAGV